MHLRRGARRSSPPTPRGSLRALVACQRRAARASDRCGRRAASRSSPAPLQSRAWTGTPFMVAGVFGFVLSFLTTLITAVTIVNERLSGTFDQLQVTPATSLEILLGKLIPLGGDLRRRRRAHDARGRVRLRGVARGQRVLLPRRVGILRPGVAVSRPHLLGHRPPLPPRRCRARCCSACRWSS